MWGAAAQSSELVRWRTTPRDRSNGRSFEAADEALPDGAATAQAHARRTMGTKQRSTWVGLTAWLAAAAVAVVIATFVLQMATVLVGMALGGVQEADYLVCADRPCVLGSAALGVGLGSMPLVVLAGVAPSFLAPTGSLCCAARVVYLAGALLLVLGGMQVTSDGPGLAVVLVPAAVATLSLAAGCHWRLRERGRSIAGEGFG